MCKATQLTGFYMMATLAFNELRLFQKGFFKQSEMFFLHQIHCLKGRWMKHIPSIQQFMNDTLSIH